MIGSILCIALQAAQTWGNEGLRQPRAGDNAVAVALAKVLRMRQNNSKFAKRTWNVPWNQ